MTFNFGRPTGFEEASMAGAGRGKDCRRSEMTGDPARPVRPGDTRISTAWEVLQLGEGGGERVLCLRSQGFEEWSIRKDDRVM